MAKSPDTQPEADVHSEQLARGMKVLQFPDYPTPKQRSRGKELIRKANKGPVKPQ